MSKAVFDTSAILAIYHQEPGRKKVIQLIERHDPLISTVNLAELYSKLSEDGLSENDIAESFDGLDIEVVAFTKRHASAAGGLRVRTKDLGLSLGDRGCLAVAISEGAIAVTADRSWEGLSDVCKIEVIR